jgi:hypothetical protein
MIKEKLFPCLLISSALLLLFGCGSTSFELKQTKQEEPTIYLSNETKTFPRKLIFLSTKEAACPTQCSEVVQEANLKRWVSRIEEKLLDRGYMLVSGAIVSRVEEKLGLSDTREKWDRTEKALLLGEKTGADAIFEVRGLWSDLRQRTFIKKKGEESFKEVPKNYADKLISEDRKHKEVSRFDVPYWIVMVELRVLDMDGNIVWSGMRSVRTTDIMPTAWKANVKEYRPNAKIDTKGNRKDQNFDYDMYYYDNLLQEQQFILIIDDLIDRLPPP